MKKAKFFFKHFLTPIFIGLVVSAVSFYVLQTFAAPPTTPYRPGETLNPSCSPGDTNCSVSSPLTFDTTNVNVPIGTTTATSLLELYSTSTSPILTITAATSTTSYDPYLSFRTGATPATKFVLGVDYSDSNKFKFATTTIGTNDILVLDQSGNIGIGTSTPAYKLDVWGDLRVNTSSTLGNVISGVWTGTAIADANISSASTWNAKQNAITLASSTTGTDFTISSSSATWTFNLPSATSTVRGLLASADWTTFNNKQAQLWGLSGSNLFASSTSWNVGIGTTTPSYKLDVIGDLRVNTSSTLGNVISGVWTGTAIGDTYISSAGTWNAKQNAITLASSTTGTDFTISSSSATWTFNLPSATSTTRGLLASTDWTTFNNKLSAAITSLGGLTGATQTFATSTDTNLGISILSSGTSHTFTPIWIGTLADARISSAATWNAMTPSSTQVIAGTGLSGGGTLTGNITLNSTGVLSLGAATGTITLTSPLTMASGVLSMPTSTASQSGYLSSADWTTFNNKQSQLWGLSGSNLFASSTSWNVGIGTTTPAQTLTVNGGLFVGTSTTGIPTLYVASTTGRVGIGTSTPSSLLDVAGIAQLRGFSTSTTGLYVDGSGNVGIGTTGPGRKLDVLYADSVAQMRLSQTGSVYSEFKVDSVGDLTVSATGGDIRLLNENFYVCAGNACPTTGYSISGTGNLVVETKVIADKFEQICPTGYIWVPGAAKFGTLPGFCVMKYEAKNVGSVATSQATSTPWVSISQETSRSTCQALGTGYHLISEAEWMTIAENIANTTINDMDDDAGLQLATGHTDNAPAAAATSTSGADPVVSGCVLTSTMENASNAYSAGSCEIQGDGAYGGDDNDKGYYMTGQNWSATGYSSGLANKAQLRTHVLSNGNVIWDMAGSVWEWTDALIIGQEEPVDDTPAGEWLEYTAITKYNNLPYVRPPDDGWSATNGIGRLYTVGTGISTYAFIRGGDWGNEAGAGVFTLNLSNAPTNTSASVGFRCAR